MEEINSRRTKIIKRFDRDPMNTISSFSVSTKEIASASVKERSPRRICKENIFFKIGEIDRKSDLKDNAILKLREINSWNDIKKNYSGKGGIFGFFLKIFRG